MTVIVAIDGPSGAGKSTVGRGVAQSLGLRVLDTGAMYRAVTLAALEAGVDLHDADACAEIARNAVVEVDGGRTLLNGRDVSAEIRGPEVTKAVSTVSAHAGLREVLVARQRAWVEEHGGGVVEGRDIGTVVFPNATVKVFLTASDEVRAQRRRADEVAAARNVAVDEVKAELERRDTLDSARQVSPLRAAPDAIEIDTSSIDADTVVADIVARVQAGKEG